MLWNNFLCYQIWNFILHGVLVEVQTNTDILNFFFQCSDIIGQPTVKLRNSCNRRHLIALLGQVYELKGIMFRTPLRCIRDILVNFALYLKRLSSRPDCLMALKKSFLSGHNMDRTLVKHIYNNNTMALNLKELKEWKALKERAP